VNGEARWANANDPQIPVALAPVVSGFASLHNFPKKPASVRSGRTAGLTRTPDGKPQITFTDGSHGIAPADFNTIYNVTPSGMTGTNVTIGVIARSNINVSDVQQFRSIFGLPTNNPTIIVNGPDPGDLGTGEEAEAVLDATWPGAVAPNATVDLVVSQSTNADPGEDLSEFYIIDNNLADVMTESFSVCEAAFGSQLAAAASFYSGLAEQAAAQGITYMVASGDSGPDSCDDPSTVPTTPQAASVNLLAATPFTVAVGGTQFNDMASPSTYWNSTNVNHGSAKSYIPENVWNESCTVAQCGSSLAGLWSSGGGQSTVFTNAQVPWQAGVAGIPAGNRALPDVSMAAADHDGYVLCLAASCQGSSPGFSILSGTSVSAQVFGGVMALVVQKIGTRLGIANYALYKLAGAETLSSCNASNVLPALPPANTCVFNDVTVGNTNIPEVNPIEMGFSAANGPGYDEATGLGSVNVTNLVNQWHTANSSTTTTTLTLNNGTAVNVTHGTAVPVGITVAPVAPATGTPTGDVSLLASSNTNMGVDGFILTNGSVSSSTTLLPGGTYQMHAHYEGDGTFLGSDSTPPVSVTVNPEGSRTSLGIVVTSGTTCSTSTSVAYGSPYVLTVVVADLNAGSTPCAPKETGSSPTGTVTVTDSVNGGAAASLDGASFKLNSFGYFEDQQIQLSPGTHSIQAAYPGDASFSASNTNAPTVTVTKAATTSKITSSPTTIAANTAFALTVIVDTQTSANPAAGSSGAAPTGTITFTATTTSAGFNPGQRDWPQPNRFLFVEVCTLIEGLFMLLFAAKRRHSAILLGMVVVIAILAGTSCGSSTNSTTTTTLGTANLTGTTDANGFAAATATLSTAKLATTGTITATYSGDGNYGNSTATAVTVTVH
jgi:subtilase family serine protease